MMLLTTIGARKNSRARLGETSVVIGVNVLYAFINEIQVDLMAGIKGRARETVNSLSTGVRGGKSQKKPYLL